MAASKFNAISFYIKNARTKDAKNIKNVQIALIARNVNGVKTFNSALKGLLMIKSYLAIISTCIVE